MIRVISYVNYTSRICDFIIKHDLKDFSKFTHPQILFSIYIYVPNNLRIYTIFGFFSTYLPIIVKNTLRDPTNIYIFRISSMRSTKWCKNLSQNFQLEIL